MPRAECTLKRKLKLSQIRANRVKKENSGLVSETSSNLNFSVYKKRLVAETAVPIETRIKDEVAPLRNQATSIIPARFSLANASKEEIA